MFICSHCDSQHLKWNGRCVECGKWGTLQESSNAQIKKINKPTSSPAQLINLADAKKITASHNPTNISELDRVLSGGIVPGSVTLLAGEPGIGKSTLVAQLAGASKNKTYYVSGEESEGQVLMRLERLKINPENIVFSNSVETGAIIASANKLKPSILIIDSIQTMIPEETESLAGTPTAVRIATAQLISFAKSSAIPILLIGQVTKEGSVAGPKTLEHLVDTVLTLEGDKQGAYRMLRAGKNRFGSTEEVGVFEMTEQGMTTVKNPSAKFLEERQNTPGSVVTCIMEGTRPFLIEIQALADKSFYPNPIRKTSGYDSGRLQMLLAIISKRAGITVGGHDIYVNIVGGMKTKETAVDLAVAAAIISSIKDKALPQNSIVVGELGLGGEIRSVPFLDRRLKEAERLGLKEAITPKTMRSIKELVK